MLDGLNKINIAGWKDNPNVSVEIAREIERASWKRSPFEVLLGKGGDRGIRNYAVKNTNPFRPRLKATLSGSGVRGNADFETNLDNLEILSQVVYPEVVANAVKSQIKHYDALEQIDFIKESCDSLTDWASRTRDRAFCAALLNDLSNIVVSDATNGTKDISTTKNTQEASKKIAKGDVISVKAIRRAIFMAQTGTNYKGKEAFPIKPVRAESKTENGLSVQHYSYIILLDSYGVHQLRNDKEWQEMQKVGVRGDSNRIFTGMIGTIDNCPVIDMGVWGETQSGLLNSTIDDSSFYNAINKQNFKNLTPPSAYAGTQAVSIGFLIGASALVHVGGATLNFYIDDTQDLGRKTICGVDRVLAIAKARFEPTQPDILSPYANTDFGVIGIAYSKE